MNEVLSSPYTFFIVQGIIIAMVFWYAFRLGRGEESNIINGTILWMVDNNFASGSEDPETGEFALNTLDEEDDEDGEKS